MRAPRTLITGLVAVALLVAGCSGSESSDPSPEPSGEQASPGIRTVSPEEAESIRTDPPDSLVILDVRTPEEFAEGHLDGAIMVDFYAEDFQAQLEELDPAVPYLLYCRSGNRSGQAAAIMEDLGYRDVANIDGGVLAWADAGLELVSE